VEKFQFPLVLRVPNELGSTRKKRRPHPLSCLDRRLKRWKPWYAYMRPIKEEKEMPVPAWPTS